MKYEVVGYLIYKQMYGSQLILIIITITLLTITITYYYYYYYFLANQVYILILLLLQLLLLPSSQLATQLVQKELLLLPEVASTYYFQWEECNSPLNVPQCDYQVVKILARYSPSGVPIVQPRMPTTDAETTKSCLPIIEA